MKSRTSYFNLTVFKKNLTRFAPCWGLYSVCAVLGLILLVSDSGKWMANNMMGVINVLCVVTPVYAMICTQLLFGDLYGSRMCNALHALPIRRETWFFTNVISGFVFHLIPTVLLTVLVAPVLAIYSVQNAAWAAPIFLLGTNLQFACFFGLAVFCALCVGSRLAQVVIYGIVNFASVILGWLINTIFVPMYYGIAIDTEPFYLFSPVVFMINAPFADTYQVYETNDLNIDDLVAVTFHAEEGTVYYFVAAAVGIGLLFAAMQLYRRRKLECAGDFMAVRGLEPVFLVVYSVIVGAVLHFFANEIVGIRTYLFLFLGLVMGWFTGKMLLARTPRVFSRGNIFRCGILVGICGLTIVCALMDPFGIESWIPKLEKVASVTVVDGPYRYPQNQITLEKKEDIAQIIAIQEATLDDYWNHCVREEAFEQAYKELIEPNPETIDDMNHYCSFTLTYQMESGRKVRRHYSIWLGDERGEYLKKIFSTPEAVLGYEEDEAVFLSRNSRLSVRDTYEGNETVIRSQEALSGLYQAILADCREGNMAQLWTFHYCSNSVYWIYLEDGSDITVFTNAENTLNWLREYGLDVDGLLKEMGK